MIFENFFLIPLIFFFFYVVLKKNNFLIENTSHSIHKNIGKENKNPILLGGVFFFSIIFIFFPSIHILSKVIFLFIVILGISSDINFLSNPKIRLLLQLFLISLLIFFENLSINDLRIIYLNDLLESEFFNYLFTLFCLATIINGSNFIDGLNGLLVSYCCAIFFSIMFVLDSNSQIIFFNQVDIALFLFSLIWFAIFNFMGKVYLGDNGSYLISIFMGFYLIKFYQINFNISPYYIALLLWYPAFENLFSLLRRLNIRVNISRPDKNHLHQLVYSNLVNFKIIKKKWINPVSSIIILFFMFPGFLIATLFPNNSKILISQLIFNLVVYILSYHILSKNLINNK